MYKILHVEINSAFHQLFLECIQSIAHVDWVSDFSKAVNSLARNNYDMVVLNSDLPKGDCYNFCESVKDVNPSQLIYFLSQETTLPIIHSAFTAGADDYLFIPFESLELKIRIESRLKKIKTFIPNVEEFKCNEFEIHKDTQSISLFSHGDVHEVKLTSLEYKILVFLSQHPGVILHREEILNSIWGFDVHVYQRSVDTHISKLRKKIRNLLLCSRVRPWFGIYVLPEFNHVNKLLSQIDCCLQNRCSHLLRLKFLSSAFLNSLEVQRSGWSHSHKTPNG